MRIASAALATAWLWLAADSAQANWVAPVPLNKQFDRADLVVVAKVGAAEPCTTADDGRLFGRLCADLEPETCLKGTACQDKARPRVILNYEDAESSICTAAGTRALLFLRQSGGLYSAVNGRDSVVVLED